MFKTKLRLRSQLLIDPDVQWPILQRTALYTGACAIYFMVVLYYSESSKIDFESPWRSLWQCADVIACWAPGLTMLTPIIAYDLLIFTNRFAGPMFRLRREMERLIKDESEVPVKLRDNDHWLEMADLFNEIRSELITLREARSPMSKSLFGAASVESNSLDSSDSETPDAETPKQKTPKQKTPKQESPETVSAESVSPESDSPVVESAGPESENVDTPTVETAPADRVDESAMDGDPSPKPAMATKSATEFSAADFDMSLPNGPQSGAGEPPPATEALGTAKATTKIATERVLGEPVPREEDQLAATK